MMEKEDFDAWSRLYSAWRAAYRTDAPDEPQHFAALLDWVERHGYAGTGLDPRILEDYDPTPAASPDAAPELEWIDDPVPVPRPTLFRSLAYRLARRLGRWRGGRLRRSAGRPTPLGGAAR